jgi:DNA-binding NtrC family response regulator
MQNVLATLTVLMQDHRHIDKAAAMKLLTEIISNNTLSANKEVVPDSIDLLTLKKSKKDFEKQLFALLSNESTVNKIQIAKMLGISRTTLWRKFREHGSSKN